MRVGRSVGLFAVALSLGAASMQLFGQGAPSHPGHPSLSTNAQSNSIPLAFAQSGFPNATLGVFYNSSVQVIGGSGLLTMTVTGDLPPGLSVEIGANTVVVSGVPSQAGQFTLQITVRDTYGAALQSDFTIQVLPQTLQTLSQSASPKVIDNETFNFHDAENVFFPVVISDNETFHFTDTESDMDAVRVLDNETITLTDSVKGLDSVVLVDRENITLTDREAEAELAYEADSENITLTDTDSFQILTVPKINWPTPSAILYGTALSGTQLNASAAFNGITVPGTYVYSPAAGTVLAGGLQTLSVIFTPTEATDYTTATASVQLQVNAPGALLTPAPGSTLSTSSVSFTWSTGAGVSAYQLCVGDLYAGNCNLFASGVTTALTAGVTGLPVNGEKLYVRLYSRIGTAWLLADYSYTTSGTPVLASLTSPTPGTALPGASATFQWSTGSGVTDYLLMVGTTGAGSRNLYSGVATPATSASVTGLPLSGETIYVRLYSEFNGSWTLYNDYTYTGAGASLLTPTPGSTLPASSIAFTWSKGVGVNGYQLCIGDVDAGSCNLYYSGFTTGLTANAANLPVNGEKLYVRLYSRFGTTWQFTDYTYMMSGTPVLATLTEPTPSSTLTGTSATFQWSAGGGITSYILMLGTGKGTHDLYDSGSTQTTSANVTGLPADGVTIYARLFSEFNGSWAHYIDYTYTETGTPQASALLSPTATTLTTSSVAFTWSKGSGVSGYQLCVGDLFAGNCNLHFSGVTTALTASVTNLPLYGENVYVRLYSKINTAWQFTDYTFTMSGTPLLAALTSPTPGSTLASPSATFQWTAGGGVSNYLLMLGTTGTGSHDLYDATTAQATSVNVTGLPTNGKTIYARLCSMINGSWAQCIDYTYTAQ
ncbi:MAG: putative Ig domain-containing protein [Terracidiphilus sp.]